MSLQSRQIRIFCVLLSLLFLIHFVFSFCPCPAPPAPGELAVTPDAAFTPQSQSAIEWYYVVGSLCEADAASSATGSCKNPVGFEVNTNMANVTLPNGHTTIVTSTIFSLTYGGEHYTATVAGLPPIYPNPLQPFDLAFATDPPLYTAQYQLLYGNPGAQDSVYSLLAVTPNATISLILRSQSPLMLHGNGGYMGSNLAPPKCNSFIYVSMPRLSVLGTVRLGNSVRAVAGEAWFDHEWGSFGPSRGAGSGWLWSGLHLGSVSVMLQLPRVHFAFNFSHGIVEVQTANGTMMYGAITSLVVLANWTSPASGNIYPVDVRLHTTVAEVEVLQITAVFMDQEVGSLSAKGLIPIYEGDAKVRVVKGSLSTKTGAGQLELVGFTPNG